MTSHLRTLLWAIALICAPLSQSVAAAPYQSSSDKGDPQLFVTAFAKNDAPAILQPTGLSVLVDKTPVQVEAVRSAKDDPLLFAILVDISRSDATAAHSIKEAAFQLFQGLANTQNQGYLVLFNQVAAVSRTPLSTSQAKEVLESARFGGGTAVYDAIEKTCKRTLSRSENPTIGRRAILLISDGEDNLSHVTREQAEEAALEEGVAIFSVVTSGPPAGQAGERVLKKISQSTGGFSTNKDLNKAVPVALAAVGAQWAVTLAPPQSPDNKLHSIQIKTEQKDIRIYAPTAVSLE